MPEGVVRGLACLEVFRERLDREGQFGAGVPLERVILSEIPKADGTCEFGRAEEFGDDLDGSRKARFGLGRFRERDAEIESIKVTHESVLAQRRASIAMDNLSVLSPSRKQSDRRIDDTLMSFNSVYVDVAVFDDTSVLAAVNVIDVW